jgi:hypothetical protein
MLSENPNIARRGYFGFVMPEHNQHTSAGGVDIRRLTKPSCAFYRERHKWALECATHRWYTSLMEPLKSLYQMATPVLIARNVTRGTSGEKYLSLTEY